MAVPAVLFDNQSDDRIVTHFTHEHLAEVLMQYGAALVLYARQWCQWPDDAVQEALCDLVQLNSPPRDVPAWLFKAVRFKAINLARAERRRHGYQIQSALERDPWFESRHETQAQARELESMLSQLPDLQREIVVAKVWGGLTFGQIADLTSKPPSTVHRLYLRALTDLKHRFEGQGDDGNEGASRIKKCNSLELNHE